MLPFYFLSVATNAAIGFILTVLDSQEESAHDCPFLYDATFSLVLALLSGIAAVCKCVNPIGAQLPVLGDLIPTLAGGTGCALFLHRYCVALSKPSPIPRTLLQYAKPLGLFSLAASILHLLFAPTLFL